MNAPMTPRLDFADVSYAEAIERAHALIPVLRERAARTEAARCLLPETVADLDRSGLMRIMQPRRWGGMELDFISILDITDIIGRGCASTAWTLANIAIHHWMLALYEEEAQQEIWGANPDAYIASGIAFPQGRGQVVEGGILLSGHWNFSSGVRSSTWNMLACLVRDADNKIIDYRMCVVPEGQYEVVDDWQVMGLSGTGSMSVKCERLFVPEHRALSMLRGAGAGVFPGCARNSAPVFRIPFGGVAAHCILGAMIGNAQAMFDALTDMVRERSTSYTTLKMRDLGTVQARVGLAGAQLDTARLLARHDGLEAQRMAEAGVVPDQALRLRQKRNCAYSMTLATDAVDTLYALAGANGLYSRGPIERIYRDQHAAAAHINFSLDAHGTAWGLVTLGGVVNTPTL